MYKKVLPPFISLAVCLLIANYYSCEWLVWISTLVFGAMIINIFHHEPADGDVITTGLNLIIEKLDQLMTKEERLAQAVADLNAGTNEIAADLQKLKDELAAGNVSEESLAALETNIAVLKDLGNAQ